MRTLDSVAVIGTGKMGEIMAAGMVRAGMPAQEVQVSDINRDLAQDVAQRHGFTLCETNRQAAQGADLVLIAVKPEVVAEVLREIAGSLQEGQIVLSIAAGVTTSAIEAELPYTVPVVRAMPNVAAQVGYGVTAICAGTRTGGDHMKQAEDLLSGVGTVLRVAESYMDAVTAVSGSGPAYFALFAEALTDAAVTAGLPRPTAVRLVAGTLLGAAHLMSDGQMLPAALREAVMSPAGTTAMGLRELEKAAVRGAVLDAVRAAMARSAELSGPPGRSG